MNDVGRTIVAMVIAAASVSMGSWTSAQASPMEQAAAALERAVASGEFKQITSIEVLQHGRSVFDHYYGTATADTHHNTRSATKTVTGALVGLAIERGFLKDTKVEILPFLRTGSPWPIPIRASRALPSKIS